MGCFNTTGFISKLPITYHDRVVCFIGVENKNISGRNLYHPASIIAPYFLPIRGTYNDYGAVNDIDRTPTVEMIEKYAKCDIETLVKGIERCIYGKTINENIAYWYGKPDGFYPDDKKEALKKYAKIHYLESQIEDATDEEYDALYAEWEKDRESHKDIIENYEKLLPFFKDWYFNKTGGDIQPVLLFEHEDFYDKLASKYRCYHMSGFYTKYNYLDEYVNFKKELKEYGVNIDDKKTKFGPSIYLPFPLVGYEPVTNGLIFRTDIPKEYHEKYNDILNRARKEHGCKFGFVGSGEEHPWLFGLFNMMEEDDVINILLSEKDELKKFCSIYKLYEYAPMYFNFSKTSGEQNYDLKIFKTLSNLVSDKADELIKRDEEECDEDDNYEYTDSDEHIITDRPINGGGA